MPVPGCSSNRGSRNPDSRKSKHKLPDITHRKYREISSHKFQKSDAAATAGSCESMSPSQKTPCQEHSQAYLKAALHPGCSQAPLLCSDRHVIQMMQTWDASNDSLPVGPALKYAYDDTLLHMSCSNDQCPHQVLNGLLSGMQCYHSNSN